MNSTGWAVVVVIIILIGGGVWWYTSAQPVVAPTNTTQTNGTDQNQPDNGVLAPKTVTVLYGPSGFSPATVTINKGDTVTFTNNGGDEMWVASAPHPAHTGYDGTDRATHCAAGYTGAPPFDQCSAGISFSFMFNQVGTWVYHNHGNSADHGTVVVQ
jgi:plastocyanin